MSRGQIVAIFVVALVGAGLWFAPTSEPVEPVEVSPNEEKIAEAVKIIEEGTQAPMKGIQLLREVLESEPQNEKALYYMGVFSVRSGQYEKAVQRFESILKNNPNQMEVRYLLGMSLLEIGDTSRSLKELEQVAISDQKELKESAQRVINELEKL